MKTKDHKLSKEDILHLAKLANLTLSDNEVKQYEEQLEKTIEYVDNLHELNTDSVQPSSHTTGQVDTFFEDGQENKRGLSQDEATQNAKKKENGYFEVNKIME